MSRHEKMTEGTLVRGDGSDPGRTLTFKLHDQRLPDCPYADADCPRWFALRVCGDPAASSRIAQIPNRNPGLDGETFVPLRFPKYTNTIPEGVARRPFNHEKTNDRDGCHRSSCRTGTSRQSARQDLKATAGPALGSEMHGGSTNHIEHVPRRPLLQDPGKTLLRWNAR